MSDLPPDELPNTPARAPGGRFAKGNPGGPGNPYARRTAAIRDALADAVTDDDLREIMRKLIDRAKGGDIQAIRELLDRLIGKPRLEPCHDDDGDKVTRIIIESIESPAPPQ